MPSMSQKLAPALALSFPILRDNLRQCHGLLHGHRRINLDTHFTAAVRDVVCSNIIGTAQHQLNVTVAHDLSPEVIGIPVLKLTQALHSEHHADISRADNTEGSAEIRSVWGTADTADVIELIQDHVNRNGTFTTGGIISKTSQLDKQEREEQRGYKCHRCFLITENDVIGTFAFAWGGKVDIGE